jgi:hypothetical protein
MLNARSGRVWLGMLLSGLTLGAYVVVAWPDTKAPTEKPRVVRTMASAGASAGSTSAGRESEPAAVLGDMYPLELFFYELSAAPLLDALIAALPPADEN